MAALFIFQGLLGALFAGTRGGTTQYFWPEYDFSMPTSRPWANMPFTDRVSVNPVPVEPPRLRP